ACSHRREDGLGLPGLPSRQLLLAVFYGAGCEATFSTRDCAAAFVRTIVHSVLHGCMNIQ
ncbi:MAG: hypothetical protein OEM60_12685, partial [Gammaproteobacteria bacterium]|nr:hypothetical protein [Gammaproteobacteria bacterium]